MLNKEIDRQEKSGVKKVGKRKTMSAIFFFFSFLMKITLKMKQSKKQPNLVQASH